MYILAVLWFESVFLSLYLSLFRWKDAAGTRRGIKPYLNPPPLPDPRPSEPSAPPSHHEPAVPRPPEAAGGVSHGRCAAHLALPAGWKPGEWVRAHSETYAHIKRNKMMSARHFSLFSTIWETSLCNFHGDWVWKVTSWFIIKAWSCGLVRWRTSENRKHQLSDIFCNSAQFLFDPTIKFNF